MAPSTVLILGGASGCVANIIIDRLMSDKKKYTCVVAGRSAPWARDGREVAFIKYDIFEKGSTEKLIATVERDFGKCSAIVNCISTGGKVSYDTTKIAYLNYCSANTLVHLATELKATLVHMSSLKVGNPEDFDHESLEGMPPWAGARSPYAWSKLACELKLTTSTLKDYSFVRIGLMDSEHAKKFYTRVRAVCNFKVKVTEEDDLQEAIETAIKAKGRHIVSVDAHPEDNYTFYRRMSGRSCLFVCPVGAFNWFFGNMLPTKMIDYVDPTHNFEYKMPL